MIAQSLTNQAVRQLLAKVFPRKTLRNCELLSGGLINTNLKISFDSPDEPVVLRVYRDGAGVCRKEVAIHSLIKRAIPVADILYAEPNDDSISFAILQFVNGLTFQQLKRTGDISAIEQASRSVGKTLAAIGQFTFPKSGRLLADDSNVLEVGPAFTSGPDPIQQLVDKFLESVTCRERLGRELMNEVNEFFSFWSARLPDLDKQPTLVHNDFGDRNILVHEQDGKWEVAAVLDWELAFSGSPLLDVGRFLRYEKLNAPLRQPFFSESFVQHGGQLPENWRQIVRVIDITGILECLTQIDLPADVELEVIGLIKATLRMSDML